MTLTIDIKPLIATLRQARGAVEPSRTYDVLQCVRLAGGGGECSVSAFNLSHEITLTLAAEGAIEPVLVNSETLTAWLSRCSDRGFVSVEKVEAGTKWTAGSASALLPALPIEQWSSFGEIVPSHRCSAGGDLAGAIGSALCAVSEDPSRPQLSGVRLEVGSIESAGIAGRLAVCGTNGVMLFARDVPADGLKAAGGVIVAIDTAKTLRQLLVVGKAALSWSDNRVELVGDGFTFKASVIEGRYPESWRASIQRRPPNVSYDGKALMSALHTVASIAPEGKRRAKMVQLQFGETETRFLASERYSSTTGEDHCKHSKIEAPPSSEMTVSADQLVKLCGALEAETIEMAVSAGEGQPVVLTGAALTDRIACSVPQRGVA